MNLSLASCPSVRRGLLAAIALATAAALSVGLFFGLRAPQGVRVGPAPSVEILRTPPPRVELFEPVELALNVSADYSNPFDPSDINVTAVLKGPARTIAVPAFYYQDYERQLVAGEERLVPVGKPHWRVRFTPTEVGEHELYVEVRDRWGNAARSRVVKFEVVPSRRPGFVRVDREGRYFVFDNGSSTFFVGLNACWSGSRGTYDYDEWFRAFADHGVNLVRIWMAPWRFGIEWRQLGRYDLAEAWRLDYVIRLAERNNIYVILCLMNHGQLSTQVNPQWSENPYNSARGGPLSRPEEFWTSERARQLFMNRLRYIVARWGYSTHILAWELWNEVDLTDNYRLVRQHVARWHREMASYLKKIDPYGHLVTTSFADPNLDPEIWSLREIDFITIHRYGPEGFEDVAGVLHGLVSRALARYGKPALVTEYGVDWRWWGEPLYYKDREGVGLHDGLWASIMAGSPATGMHWWWDNYVYPLGLLHHFKAIAEFLRGVQPAGSRLRPARVEVVPLAPELANLTLYPSLGWARPLENYFVVRLDGVVEGDVAQIPAFIQGRAHPELRNNPTFRATFPSGGRVAVRVNSVSVAGAVLAIYVDGRLALSADLPDRDGKNDAFSNEYGTEFAVDIPPGEHEVRVDNLGNDWYTIDYVRLEGAVYSAARARVLCLSNGTMALLWIKNSERTWRAALEGRAPPPLSRFMVRVPGLEDGLYEVKLYDTRTGEVVEVRSVEVRGGVAELHFDRLEDDLAVRMRRVG